MDGDHMLFVGLMFAVVTCLFSLKGGLRHKRSTDGGREGFWDGANDQQLTGVQRDLTDLRGTVNTVALVTAKNAQDLQKGGSDYAAVAGRIAAVSDRVDKLQQAPLDIKAQTDALSAQFQTLSDQQGQLRTQVAALAARPAPQQQPAAAPVDDGRITALQAQLVKVQNQQAQAESQVPSRLTAQNAATGDFVTVQPGSIVRRTGAPLLSFGQATDASGDPAKGVVSNDVSIAGQPDLWHALVFGGTANDPQYSTIVAERKVAGGQSELLLAKFKDYDNGQGPDQIRHFAPRHVFATLPDGTATLPAPADAPAAFGAIEANNKVMMTIDPSGVVIGKHKLVSDGNTLNVCDSKGNACKAVYS